MMMAITFRWQCTCGQSIIAYVPKEKAWRDLGIGIDRPETEETLAEERREAQKLADTTGSVLRICQDSWLVGCPECGDVVDLEAQLRENKARSEAAQKGSKEAGPAKPSWLEGNLKEWTGE